MCCIKRLSGILCRINRFCPVYCAVWRFCVHYFVLCGVSFPGTLCCVKRFCPVCSAVHYLFLSVILCCVKPFHPAFCATQCPFCPISCVVYTVFVRYIVLCTVSLTVVRCPPLCLLLYSLPALFGLYQPTLKRVSLAKFITTNIRANSTARCQEGSMIEWHVGRGADRWVTFPLPEYNTLLWK
jgi:hypothetical protein